MTEDGRAILLYVLTCKHGNMTGCFRLSIAYAGDDLQWESERVSKGFRELSDNGFITRDNPSQWVIVHKFLKWNQFENPNVAKAAVKIFDKMPIDALKPLLVNAFIEFAPHLSDEFRGRLETLREQYRKPVPDPVPFPSPDPVQSATGVRTPAVGKGTPPQESAKAPKAAKETSEKVKSASAITFDFYSAAYESRYGVPATANATVRGILNQFVGRVPAEEAPHIAAFYVQHNHAYYVNSGHAVQAMLRDAEKLRREWQTGQAGTQSDARRADRRQTNSNAFRHHLDEAMRREAGEGDVGDATIVGGEG